MEYTEMKIKAGDKSIKLNSAKCDGQFNYAGNSHNRAHINMNGIFISFKNWSYSEKEGVAIIDEVLIRNKKIIKTILSFSEPV